MSCCGDLDDRSLGMGRSVVYIICMNDCAEKASLSKINANDIMLRLKKEYWDKNKYHFKSYEDYCTQCYWYIHEVGLEE
jgi:hypothetical protein